MAIRDITKEEIARNQIEGNLPDRPSQMTLYGGKVMTPAEVKAAHDKLPKLVAERFNELIAAIRTQGEGSLADEILTGIREGHTLADMFKDIVSGSFTSYLTVGEGSLNSFFVSFLNTVPLVGEGAPTGETVGEIGRLYLETEAGKAVDIYVCTGGEPYTWIRYVPKSDYYIPSVKEGVLSFTPTNPDMPAVPDSDIDPLPEAATDGYVLTVESGKWVAKAPPKALPSITAEDDGKVLTAEGGVWLAKEPVKELPEVNEYKDGYALMVEGGVWVAKSHVVHADAPLLVIEGTVAKASTTSLFGSGMYQFYADGIKLGAPTTGQLDLSTIELAEGIHSITATLQVSDSAYRVSDHSNAVVYVVGELGGEPWDGSYTDTGAAIDLSDIPTVASLDVTSDSPTLVTYAEDGELYILTEE